MLRFSLAALALVALVGCQVGAEFDPARARGGQTGDAERTRLAAFAASQQFPRDAEASDQLRAAALINRGDNTIRILNFSDRALTDAVVWINGAYVHRVGSIPSNGSVVIPRSKFYDATGRSLADATTTATRVQVQWNDQLYNLQGPVNE